MSDLSELSIDQIQNVLLIEMYANENKKLNQYILFNKFIERFNLKNKYISPLTKQRFLLVLKNLKNRYDDIEITIENKIIYAICKKETDTPLNLSSYETFQDDVENGFDVTLFENIDVYSHIIDNKLYEEFEYEDSNGNTLYHDVVSGNNYYNLKKLIDEERFNYLKRNKYDKTPLDNINSQEINNIFINKLFLEISELKKRVNKLEKEDVTKKINELSLLQLLKIKIINLDFLVKIKIISSIVVIALLFIYFYF